MVVSRKSFLPSLIIFLYVVFALIFVNDGVTAYYHIVDGIFLATFLLNFILNPKLKFDVNIYSRYILIFSIYILISFLWAPSRETLSKNLFLQSSLAINSFALFFLVNKEKGLRIIIYGYLFYSFLNNLIYLGLVPVHYFSSQDAYLNGRFIGTNLSSNLLAIDLCFNFILSLFILKESKNKFFRLFIISNIFISFFTILGTGSKKGLGAFIVILILNLYKRYSKSLEKKILFIPLIALVLLLIVQLFGGYIRENFIVIDRFSAMFDVFMSSSYSDESTDQRVDFIEIGWEGFLNSPIFGHGQDAFAFFNEFYSHNNFIELLFNLGLVGFVLYYIIFIKLFSLNRRIKGEFSDKITFLLLLMVFLDSALVSYNLRSYMIILTFIHLYIFSVRNEKAINIK